jgi:hypothetical protein
MTMGLLGKLLSKGLEGMDDVYLGPRRKFNRNDLIRIADQGASNFRSDALNLLSCYELEGEFGLYAALSNYITTKNPMTTEINTAVQDGDEVGLAQAFQRAMEFAFVTLLEKGALTRLQLVEKWPAEAIAEYERIRRSVVSVAAAAPAPAASVAAAAPVVPVVRETPIETCAREFKELPSRAWKTKWLDDQRNRPTTEQAVAEGRI